MSWAVRSRISRRSSSEAQAGLYHPGGRTRRTCPPRVPWYIALDAGNRGTGVVTLEHPVELREGNLLYLHGRK